MTQQSLFAPPRRQSPRQLFEAWLEFHRNNPQVYQLFKSFAESALSAGRRVGARMIGERIRWYCTIDTIGAEYKVSDHTWPYYARYLMHVDPRFRGFFELRSDVPEAWFTEAELQDSEEG